MAFSRVSTLAVAKPYRPVPARPRVTRLVNVCPVDLARQEENRLVEDLRNAFIAKFGSLLRAWRELDRNGDGSLTFMEFAEAVSRIGWSGDISKVWGILVNESMQDGGDRTISLHDISPEDAELLDCFTRWVKDSFGGAIEMFQAVDADGSNSLSLEEFLEACEGFGSAAGLEKLYTQALDVRGKDDVSLSEVLFLEEDRLKRRAAVDPMLVLELEEGRRLAKRNRRRRRFQKEIEKNSLKAFKKKLSQAAGLSFIRGWRKILDLDGNLTISKAELFKGCKQIAFEGDILVLWKSMDIDGDGFAVLEEVHPECALILAGFKKWCLQHGDSCVKAVEQLSVMQKRRSQKWNLEDFMKALRDNDFDYAKGPKAERSIQMLHAALDIDNSGSIGPNDAAFLDHWMPVEWLLADADFAARDQFLGMLRQRYSSMLVAWRRLLDRSGTNCVAYKDFVECCRLLKIEDLAPGVWRAFDRDCSGSISLQEIDPPSQKVLENFKLWAESTFGNIHKSFRAMATMTVDRKDVTSLTYMEFKKGVRELGYKGDARMLFDCLKPGAGGGGSEKAKKEARIAYEDMRHLESWEDLQDDEGDDGEDGEQHTPREPQHPWERRRKICGRCMRHSPWTIARELCVEEDRLTKAMEGLCSCSRTPSVPSPQPGHRRRKRQVVDSRLRAQSHGSPSSHSKSAMRDMRIFCSGRHEHAAFTQAQQEKPKPNTMTLEEQAHAATLAATKKFTSPGGSPFSDKSSKSALTRLLQTDYPDRRLQVIRIDYSKSRTSSNGFSSQGSGTPKGGDRTLKGSKSMPQLATTKQPPAVDSSPKGASRNSASKNSERISESFPQRNSRLSSLTAGPSVEEPEEEKREICSKTGSFKYF